MSDALATALQAVLIAVVSGGGVSFLMVGANRRKTREESDGIFVASAEKWVSSQDGRLEKLVLESERNRLALEIARTELSDLRHRMDRRMWALEVHMQKLENIIRSADLVVPPRPDVEEPK